MYVTNRALLIDFDGVAIHIPEGHPVNKLPMGTPPGYWYSAAQPYKLLDPKTQGFTLHAATYHGIPIPPDAVTEKPR